MSTENLLLVNVLWWPMALLSGVALVAVVAVVSRYKLRCLTDFFATTLCAAILIHPSSTARGIPVISLIWDLCMVMAALEANRALLNGRNQLWMFLACAAVTLLQWYFGWPWQDTLLLLVAIAGQVCSLFCLLVIPSFHIRTDPPRALGSLDLDDAVS